MINKRPKEKVFEGLGKPVARLQSGLCQQWHRSPRNPRGLGDPAALSSVWQECLGRVSLPCPSFGGADLLPTINLSGLLPLQEDFSSIKTLACLFPQQQLCPSEPR